MKNSKDDPLKGMGKKLRLHIIIPALYVLVMVLALIISHCNQT